MNGHITYVFDLGDGPVKIRDTSKSKLNDSKWHAVSIGRPAPKRHTLAVDDHVTAANSQGSNENLDLDGILYIGRCCIPNYNLFISELAQCRLEIFVFTKFEHSTNFCSPTLISIGPIAPSYLMNILRIPI